VASCQHKARTFSWKGINKPNISRQTHGHHDTVMVSFLVCNITRTI